MNRRRLPALIASVLAATFSFGIYVAAQNYIDPLSGDRLGASLFDGLAGNQLAAEGGGGGSRPSPSPSPTHSQPSHPTRDSGQGSTPSATTNHQAQSQTQGRGGAAPSGRDPAMGSGNQGNTGATNGAGDHGCGGGGCNGNTPTPSGGAHGSDPTNNDNGTRQGSSPSQPSHPTRDSGQGSTPNGNQPSQAQQAAQLAREYADYKNPNAVSRTPAGIGATISHTFDALSNAMSNLMGGPAQPTITTHPGTISGLDGDQPTYSPSTLQVGDFKTLAEPRVPQEPHYDVTAEQLDKEFKARDPSSFKQLPVTEPFVTPFGYLDEVVDPAALKTPLQRQVFLQSVGEVIYGLPAQQVASMVGNATVEGDTTWTGKVGAQPLDPTAVGDTNLKDMAFGVFQERGARKQSLEEFSGVKITTAGSGIKTTITSGPGLEAQFAHAVAELQGTAPQKNLNAEAVGRAFAKDPSMSVETATRMFAKTFESPRGSNDGASAAKKADFEKTVAARTEAAKQSLQNPNTRTVMNVDTSQVITDPTKPQTPVNSPTPKKQVPTPSVAQTVLETAQKPITWIEETIANLTGRTGSANSNTSPNTTSGHSSTSSSFQ